MASRHILLWVFYKLGFTRGMAIRSRSACVNWSRATTARLRWHLRQRLTRLRHSGQLDLSGAARMASHRGLHWAPRTARPSPQGVGRASLWWWSAAMSRRVPESPARACPARAWRIRPAQGPSGPARRAASPGRRVPGARSRRAARERRWGMGGGVPALAIPARPIAAPPMIPCETTGSAT